MLHRFFFGKHLDDDEELIFAVHKHWLVGVRELLWPTISFVLLWVVLFRLRDRYVFYVVSLLSMGTILWWLRNFFDYYLDVWLVTNKGVIDLEWKGWFHRNSARVLYSDIQSVSYEVKGIVPTLLNTGTIELEKISTGGVIQMQNVKRPRRVESMILHALESYMHSKNLKDAKTVKNILAEFVAGTMQTRDFSAPGDDDDQA